MSNEKKHILVVEDNFIAAKAAQFLFEKLGCTVESVDDGDKAVELVKIHQFDAICMDIGLQTMSGLEACVLIRKYEEEHQVKQIPIIAVTGNNSEKEAQEYLSAGMQAVIVKPLTLEKAQEFLSYVSN